MTVSQDEPFKTNPLIFQLLTERLPGKIIKKFGIGHYKIKPLFTNLPLTDGTKVEEFVAFAHDVEDRELIPYKDYVTFSWHKPGERATDKDGQPGDPKAVEVKKVSQKEADGLAEEIRKNIADELRDELAKELTKLKQERESLAEREKEVTFKLNYLEPYGIQIPPQSENRSSAINEEITIPENLGTEWAEILNLNGMYVNEKIAKSYLLALITALYSGRFILLNGSVGVGKTSIVKHSARLLGGTSKIIPVRPAWLDPSDLLGFFDPINDIFRPATFLTALNEAKKKPDRLHLVCLDELNLAKIENYGADLLSTLEYSRSKENTDEEGLFLYSGDIWKALGKERKQLQDRNHEEKLDFKEIQRLERLDTLFEDYPASTFKIPNNLVFLGTLNSDETTYDLSPKLIDRSFVITYPPANLKVGTISNLQETEQRLISVKSLKKRILDIIKPIEDNIDSFDRLPEWTTIQEWNEKYFCEGKLGRPLGYRAKGDYKVFSAAAHILGLSSDECLAHFLFTKVIPRVYFFRNKDTELVFREWLEQLEYYQKHDPANIIDSLDKQLTDQQRQNINYWA
ncbi:AAA family ATPase [Coleofasciculus sp. FACHB-T130]|nr:AAA family ATPase [Coleofasciculus sp. FACHB-T130]